MCGLNSMRHDRYNQIIYCWGGIQLVMASAWPQQIKMERGGRCDDGPPPVGLQPGPGQPDVGGIGVQLPGPYALASWLGGESILIHCAPESFMAC